METLHFCCRSYTVLGGGGQAEGGGRAHSIPVLLGVVSIITSNLSQARKLSKMSQTVVANPLISI